MERIKWVDNAKAIAIYCVVLGHFYGLPPGLKRVIYAFHLPLFLVISGFLIHRKFNGLSIQRIFNYQLYPLIKLYFLFSFISVVIFWIFYGAQYHGIPFMDLIERVVYGVHGKEKRLLHENGALWYFPFFVSSLVMFYLLMKLPQLLAWLLGILYAMFSMTYDGEPWPWALDIAGVGVLFLLLGGGLKHFYEKFKSVFTSMKSLYIAPCALILLFYLCAFNGYANINRSMFGEYVLLYVVNALIGCWLIIVIAHHMRTPQFVALFSAHTLIIFSIHLYFVKSLRFVSNVDNLLNRTALMLLLSFFITYLCMKISQLMMPLLNKYVLGKAT